ncbi:MAG TPA: peptidase M28 family protein, partial [Gemmatimonadetes bacterium]|nr:peptidase M28 family protein [Gemmatimonadota bacterium]
MPRRTSHRAPILSVLLLGAGLLAPEFVRSQDIADAYRDDANRLIDAALANHDAYARLGELVDLFGHRVSGSVALEQAIDWIMEQMESDGLDNVRGDMVMVPHWVRGEESLEMTLPRPRSLPMLGLGGSIATPVGGIRAEVLVVSSFDELERRADEAQGK